MKKDIHNKIPKDGIAGLKENLVSDLQAGFMICMIALPLSLGIASASEFPSPVFGLVSAIIGGIVVSFIAGSKLTIKGPAAGLIVICSGAIAEFGGGEAGWHLALGAMAVAAVLQIVFGILKWGRLSDFFPGAAIHGMLAAIGIIIMSKQIHILLGIAPSHLKGKSPLELFALIPDSLVHENAHLTEIGLACLAILIIFNYIKNEKIKKIPAPVIVLVVSVVLGIVLNLKTDGEVHGYALVQVESIVDIFKNRIVNVDFSAMFQHPGAFIEYVMLFALIGSIESLLTVKAIDGIDPFKRRSDADKDLIAVGAGNFLSSFLGGLPMISEVVRSSANVGYGAKTRWANFFHGSFLLFSLLFALPLIRLIPNSALAAMLVYTGFRLAHPREFKHMWHLGKEQFLIFVSTVIITLSTDLLLGVASGILIKIIIHLFNGASISSLFRSDIEVMEINGSDKIEIFPKRAAVFTNLIQFKNALYGLPKGKQVYVNFCFSYMVDHSTLSMLDRFIYDYKNGGGEVHITGMEHHRSLSNDPLATRVLKNT